MFKNLKSEFLKKYFDRIGYQGPATPTLDVLRQLHLLHPQSIPFENILPYTGQRVMLDVEAVFNKMVTNHRGGYCFEHNVLFLAVLKQIGFDVVPLVGRVRWQVPAGVETGLTHMLLRVDLSGRSWFADVAFGSTTQTAPLEFLLNHPQTTPHGIFRIVEIGSELCLEFQTNMGWQPVYRYTLEPAVEMDLEIGNWYTSTHPKSVFLNSLLISRTQPDGRELMVNEIYTHRDHTGQHRRYRHTDAEVWAECLRQHFDLHLAPSEVATLFRQVIAHSSEAAAELMPH
ncbi:MAG: arylamine N-acetyltransferase [Comamonas sp.]|jgi:N-hydroxyarylamine O-acetyltransferase|uniref:arylamine N-acetyltransferase family protein n=1 Tax=Comamonas sp. TaxID=34028 RepID=UPI002834C342|nr:arylamine N-acetyltransferase [Comamonas sp.]MDR0214108.1 arylamine N-acetyltransferase [Comamonas sp.]